MDEKIKELEKRIFKLEMDAYVSDELLTKARFELHKIKMYVVGINFLIVIATIYWVINFIYQIINYFWGK